MNTYLRSHPPSFNNLFLRFEFNNLTLEISQISTQNWGNYELIFYRLLVGR